MTDLDELSSLAVRLATSAGDILLEGRRSGFGRIDTKSSSVDIVTETDRASEAHIASTLELLRPDDSVLGEEGTSRQGTTGVRWVIDPLDGTVNFTYGIPAFAVCIGVEIDGERTIGVVFNPVTGELFRARAGEGAFLNDEPISVSTETDPAQSLVATGFSYVKELRARDAAALVDVLPAVRDIRRIGSAALDLCAVACGRVDAYFEAAVMPWDISAAAVIATEAGAAVTSLNGGPAAYDVVAANPRLHSALLPLVGRE